MALQIFKRKIHPAKATTSNTSHTPPASLSGFSESPSTSNPGSRPATALYRNQDSWSNGSSFVNVNEVSNYKAVSPIKFLEQTETDNSRSLSTSSENWLPINGSQRTRKLRATSLG